MSGPSLNAAPGWRVAVRAQLRMLALLQRRDLVILGLLVTGLVTLSLYGIANATIVMNDQVDSTVMILPGFAIPLAILAALWPLGVWRKDSPEQRGYFWSLPYARGPHTLLRAAAGWTILMAVCVIILAIGLGLVLVAETRFGPVDVSLARWYVPFATATLAYLLVSTLAVTFDSPIRVVIFTGLAVLGVVVVSQVMELSALADAVGSVLSSLFQSLVGPIGRDGPEIVVNGNVRAVGLAEWAANYAIWTAIGAVALVLSAFRFRDAR